MGVFRNSVQRLTWMLRFEGVLGTALTFVIKLLQLNRWTTSLAHRCLQKREMLFDARFGIETADRVPVEQLGVTEKQAASAILYIPSSPARFLTKITSLAIDYRNYEFLDLGSGKGRVLLLASELPFKQVNGIEISEKLHQIAIRNIASYNSKTQRCRNIRSVCCDVSSYVFSCEPTVIYLFNPFQGPVIESLLDNIRVSLLQSPRHVIIMYFNPLHKNLFDKADFLEQRESNDPSWAIYDACAPHVVLANSAK